MIRFNVKKKIQRINYISRSRKLSLALKNILLNKMIGIVDIGAGHRYLPVLLNFDGIAKIGMVDPNKSIEWSYDNFRKLIKHPNNLLKFKFGISDKTSKIKYYITNTLTGSTFVNVFNLAKKNKKNLENEYFGKKKNII